MKNTKTSKSYEIMADVIAYASVLMKFGGAEILSNQSVFVESLNVVGFRTSSGKEFTKMSFRKVVERLKPAEKKMLIDEFNLSQRGDDLIEVMYGNQYA